MAHTLRGHGLRGRPAGASRGSAGAPGSSVGTVGGAPAGAKNACHIEESVAFLLDNIDDDATTATIDTMRCGARRTRRLWSRGTLGVL
jgi:hypothetical protein